MGVVSRQRLCDAQSIRLVLDSQFQRPLQLSARQGMYHVLRSTKMYRDFRILFTMSA